MDDITVSIIIPAYNAQNWVGRAIDSVLAQSYRNVEIVVINDGSGDGTEQVCMRYGEKIRYYRQANAGVSAARNYGIQLARGEVIGFLDADDELLPTMVELLSKPLLDYPDAAACSGAHLRLQAGPIASSLSANRRCF